MQSGKGFMKTLYRIPLILPFSSSVKMRRSTRSGKLVEEASTSKVPSSSPRSSDSSKKKKIPLVQATKVTGTRLSGVKHSGLLAADEEQRHKVLGDKMREEDHMDYTLSSEPAQSLPQTDSANGHGESSGDLNDTFLEDYFTSHSKKSGKTSNHTLSKLSCPKMDVKTVKTALSAVPRFKSDIAALLKEYSSMFNYWLFQISKGFNILLYGVGSKRNLLEDFRKQILSSSCHMVINGFFPELNIKQILNQLSIELLGHSGTFKTNLEHAHFIAKTLLTKVNKIELFLIVHNIDGLSLRSESSQTALCVLAQSPSIHMLASIDHINAPLMWDQKKLSNFNWLWHDATTFKPYTEECSYENCLLVQQSGSLGLGSLIHVTQSLTSNAQGIFNLLAKHQLERVKGGGADKAYLGMSFQDCYRKCREEFLVNSDLTLRTQLIEFRDHKLLKSRKGPDGAEYLLIPVDKGILTQFLEQHFSEE